MQKLNISDTDSFYQMVLDQNNIFSKLVDDLSINVTSMFRDPQIFLFLRQNIIPRLVTYPCIRIWSAGVGSGEEAYSLAILLKEAGIYDHTLIYATDINNHYLNEGVEGKYTLSKLEEYRQNYIESGGTGQFEQYYDQESNTFTIHESLRENIVFSTHNLVTDSVFNDFHLILCRNVLIYFNKQLVNKVLQLFTDSLISQCYLCLGAKETINLYSKRKYYSNFAKQFRVYRKLI